MQRRDIVSLAAVALVPSVGAMAQSRYCAVMRTGEYITPVPLPAQMPVQEGYIDVPGARLFYWDTGGSGAAILLAHPGTGSALIWGYQQPALAAAGYRVIAWSRRGHARTIVSSDERANVTDDLDQLADALGVDQFHALGSAAGGGVMLDYALARGDRLRSLTVACSIGNIADREYLAKSAALRPASFNQLPAEVRELGPCYRAADPEGAERWIELERSARTAPMGPPQGAGRPGGGTQWSDVATLKIPILWITGDADLFVPPPLLAEFHRHTPGSEMVVIQGAGHSAYWEQPRAFNAAVLAFLERIV